MTRLINSGNVEDVKCSLMHSADYCTIGELEEEILAERKGYNRVTVIRLLERAIKAKKNSLKYK